MKRVAIRIAFYSILILLSIIWWLPLLWSVIVSFKPAGSPLANPEYWFRKPFTLDNYLYVFTSPQSNIPAWLFNSTVTAVISTVSIVILSALAGYAFSCFQFRGKKALFWVVMAGMMVPSQSLLIPMYIMFNNLKLHNTYLALILPYLGSSFGVILMKQFMDGLPHALFDAARIDGCSSSKLFWKIIIPLVKPAIASLCIFVFFSQWNDFLWPYISITKPNMMTVPVGVVMFRGSAEMDKGYALASNVVAITPVLIAFLLFQKNIVKGVTLSGIKE